VAERAVVSEREQRVLGMIETARARRARFTDARVTMAHGAGGRASQTLVEGLFVPALAPTAAPEALGDSALLDVDGLGLAVTTDTYVVTPIRFPGGSIGELAVNGTVNDLAVAGARPLALTLGMVLEEGLGADELRAEVDAIASAARAAGVAVVAGDTKVVQRGHCDRMYLNTSGIGRVDPRATLAPTGLRPGDRLLLSGPVGNHGVAIMLARDEFDLAAEVRSDTRALWPMVDALLDAAGPHLHCLRDATRGGAASVLNELARASGVAMVVREAAVPVDPAVAGACEILGIDPMYVANEGVMVAAVAPDGAETALAALRASPGGERAVEIGEVRTEPPGMVLVETAFGGRRVMDQLVGDPLPRIC
jgi:hydrogenase expression/formation protein HypE